MMSSRAERFFIRSLHGVVICFAGFLFFRVIGTPDCCAFEYSASFNEGVLMFNMRRSIALIDVKIYINRERAFGSKLGAIQCTGKRQDKAI